jgi:hypothetical protein
LHIEAGFEYNVGGSTNLYFSATFNSGLNNVFSDDYKIPTVDRNGNLVINSESGEPALDRRVKASTNLLLVTIGAYF